MANDFKAAYASLQGAYPEQEEPEPVQEETQVYEEPQITYEEEYSSPEPQIPQEDAFPDSPFENTGFENNTEDAWFNDQVPENEVESPSVEPGKDYSPDQHSKESAHTKRLGDDLINKFASSLTMLNKNKSEEVKDEDDFFKNFGNEKVENANGDSN